MCVCVCVCVNACACACAVCVCSVRVRVRVRVRNACARMCGAKANSHHADICLEIIFSTFLDDPTIPYSLRDHVQLHTYNATKHSYVPSNSFLTINIISRHVHLRHNAKFPEVSVIFRRTSITDCRYTLYTRGCAKLSRGF